MSVVRQHEAWMQQRSLYPTAAAAADLTHQWTHWDLSPGPSACGGDGAQIPVCPLAREVCGRGSCGLQGTLLHPCFVLSYYAQCLCRLLWGALCPHPRTGQGLQLISPREMQQLVWSSACPAAARRGACAVLLTTGVSPHLGSVTHGLYSS